MSTGYKVIEFRDEELIELQNAIIEGALAAKFAALSQQLKNPYDAGHQMTLDNRVIALRNAASRITSA